MGDRAKESTWELRVTFQTGQGPGGQRKKDDSQASRGKSSEVGQRRVNAGPGQGKKGPGSVS